MKNNAKLTAIIDSLPTTPADVVGAKKLSVRDAIVQLREVAGEKVFTAHQLKSMVEVAFPELIPVAYSNLTASISRSASYIEKCGTTGSESIYRFKKGAVRG